ncbi:helix-turn-helix domain-containing protein [Myxococcota bacterium]|nr:helix-turn-helix domain-containing protein [Myxococcota bacterium]
MEILSTHTDTTILGELGNRVTRLRVEQGLTQARLAYEAGISKRTLERLEAGSSIQFSGLLRVLRALSLTANLNSLIPEPLASPMKQLEHAKTTRKRPPRKKPVADAVPFTWGDQ